VVVAARCRIGTGTTKSANYRGISTVVMQRNLRVLAHLARMLLLARRGMLSCGSRIVVLLSYGKLMSCRDRVVVLISCRSWRNGGVITGSSICSSSAWTTYSGSVTPVMMFRLLVVIVSVV
jgi:hypothetical protein